MKVHLFAMPTIPVTPEQRREERPVGRSTTAYQRMLAELEQLVVCADQAGITSFGTTEHHFHTEGGEACPNPLLMYSRMAARTERIMFVPLSIVLTADNPIRIAENVALFDQLYPGRVGVAFARGYQHRWMYVLMQRDDAVSMMGDADMDALNRSIFNEHLDVVLKAWTEDAFEFDGEHFQVPYPHSGITGWLPTEWTRAYGADGELDDEGVIKKLGVIPRPFQDPHPQLFVPVTASSASLVNAARRNMVAFISESRPEKFAEACRTYQAEAAAAGFEREVGANCGGVRQIVLADSSEEAFELAAQTNGLHYHHYFEVLGHAEQMRLPSDPPDQMVRFADEYECTQRMVDTEFLLCGTPDEVIGKLEGQMSCFGAGKLEWLNWLFFMQGTASIETQQRQVELFCEKVWPAFGKPEPVAAAA
jgi:alkanesulfonate monooxygenase SsuD/methylene tetrahydromethanopterin reductase-like flavin-dependent oxidoreductase (luciferase family)